MKRLKGFNAVQEILDNLRVGGHHLSRDIVDNTNSGKHRLPGLYRCFYRSAKGQRHC